MIYATLLGSSLLVSPTVKNTIKDNEPFKSKEPLISIVEEVNAGADYTNAKYWGVTVWEKLLLNENWFKQIKAQTKYIDVDEMRRRRNNDLSSPKLNLEDLAYAYAHLDKPQFRDLLKVKEINMHVDPWPYVFEVYKDGSIGRGPTAYILEHMYLFPNDYKLLKLWELYGDVTFDILEKASILKKYTEITMMVLREEWPEFLLENFKYPVTRIIEQRRFPHKGFLIVTKEPPTITAFHDFYDNELNTDGKKYISLYYSTGKELKYITGYTDHDYLNSNEVTVHMATLKDKDGKDIEVMVTVDPQQINFVVVRDNGNLLMEKWVRHDLKGAEGDIRKFKLGIENPKSYETAIFYHQQDGRDGVGVLLYNKTKNDAYIAFFMPDYSYGLGYATNVVIDNNSTKDCDGVNKLN